jgi:23S rRNA (uracil1939-C5)-methyltransferase
MAAGSASRSAAVTEAGPQVNIRAIAAGGDGVATLPDGRTVFVPRAAPGDHLVLRDLQLHKRFARAEIAAEISPGPDRVIPPCPHYLADRCGSCQLMHLSAGAQRVAKGRIAGDAMRRIAHFELSDPDVTPSPEEFGYRSKVTFTMQRGRLGYHPVNQPTRVFEVRVCLVAHPALRSLHAALRGARSHLPQDNARVVLRLDRAHGLHVIVITPARADSWTGGRALHRALMSAGASCVVWWQPEDGTARAIAGAEDPWPATVFEQVHPAMGVIVRNAALEALGELSGMAAWDLYAGIGETTSGLVSRGAVVSSVESDPRAVALAESRGPAGPRRLVGRVEDVVATLSIPHVVVTNPPRTGMAPRAIEALLRANASRIAYISCDPATLARDLAHLVPTYRLASLQGFDQFPQTAHLESLAVLEHS